MIAQQMKGLIWVPLSASKRRTKINLFFWFVFLFIFYSGSVVGQDISGSFSIMFYNVENLFDVADNPLTNDTEFTYEGNRHWTSSKMKQKLLNLSKVILSASGWQPPAVVGMCEIENRRVLELLVKDTPLNKFSYGIIHKESSDPRGIDVALIYRKDLFYPLQYSYYPLLTEKGEVRDTREILYINGILAADTIHLFFNHWPSRYSGLMESRPERTRAAVRLRSLTDSLQKVHVNPKIVLMGDFNDQPQDETIQINLGAKAPQQENDPLYLYNLSLQWQKEGRGTLKYQARWFVFDQVIITGSLLNGNGLKAAGAKIAELPFLLEEDTRYGGMKLNRTWTGYRYNGGFSDHLPVLLNLEVKN